MGPEALMRLALDAARRGIIAGQSPFGCSIYRNGKIIAACHNTVWLTTDITAHAEVNALREACRRSQQITLEDAIVATTCEPCPMCMAALHWARVDKVYFGATIADASAAGFNELSIPAADIVDQGASSVQLVSGVLSDDCRDLFQQWSESKDGRTY
jgi:tRNA(Arg) A34 adenosine deaminase TadA